MNTDKIKQLSALCKRWEEITAERADIEAQIEKLIADTAAQPVEPVSNEIQIGDLVEVVSAGGENNASASAMLVLIPESQPDSPQGAKAHRKADSIPNIALGLYSELQQARRRCNPNVPVSEPKAKGATREIERCLREGLSVDQLRHVIAVWEAMVKSGKRLFEHFNSVTPFRASNVHAYVEMPLETAKAGRTDPRKSDADLAREAGVVNGMTPHSVRLSYHPQYLLPNSAIASKRDCRKVAAHARPGAGS